MRFLKNIFSNKNSSGESYKSLDASRYFDNAAATQTSAEVIKAMREVQDDTNNLGLFSNPSGIYKSGVFAKRQIEDSRKKISDIMNCHSDEVVFTSSGTESNNLALLGYVKNYVINKKENTTKAKVITTNIEHAAVLEPLRYLEKMGLIDIVYMKVDETGVVNVNDLREILKSEKGIILVSVMYANNETGRVQPVKEIGRVIEEYNREIENKIKYHIDACQAANYLDIDTKKLRVDLMSVNSSKIYGPKGIALLYKNRNTHIDPIVYGGGQERGLRSGTENIVGIVGFARAMEKCENLKNKNKSENNNKQSEIERLINLQDYFVTKIQKEIPGVKVYTHRNDINKIIDKKAEERDSKINFFNIESLPNNINIGLPGMLSDEMVIRLDNVGFAVSHKSACASEEVGEGSYVLRAMGASEKESNENIRVTMGRQTTQKSTDELISNIKEIYFKYRLI